MSVFVVLFLLYIVRTLLAVLVGSFSRMSSIYGSNPFKTRSCKQVDPMYYYCLDQYTQTTALHSECFRRVEIKEVYGPTMQEPRILLTVMDIHYHTVTK